MDIILEQQFRGEIPACSMHVDRRVIKELNRLYPGYEFIYHAGAKQWVLYHVKQAAGAKCNDLLFKQFVIPKGRSPEMCVLRWMSEQDKGNESLKSRRLKLIKAMEEQEAAKEYERRDLREAMNKDFETLVTKQRRSSKPRKKRDVIYV